MLTYLSRIRYFFYFWLRKSSHRTIPHQSPIRIKAVYVTLPFRLSGPENLRYRTMSKQKTISQTFWLLCPTPSGSWHRRNSKLFIIMWQVATDFQSVLLAFYQPLPWFTAATFSSTKYFLYLEYLPISYYIVTRSCYLIC